MDSEETREQARDKTYKHYKSEVVGSDWLLFILTALPYHALGAFIFWQMDAMGEPYLIFVSVHVLMGVILIPLLDWFKLVSSGARNERFFMQEEQHLLELYGEALQSTKEAHPHLYKAWALPDSMPKARTAPLYIVDDIRINAYATIFGIAISKGAVSNLSDEEIQGIIVHELGHESFTAFINFLQGFMCFGALTVAIYKYIRKYTAVEVSVKNGGAEVTTKAANFFCVFLDFVFLVPSYYFKFVSSMTFRVNEFRADYIAVLAGYGEGLKNALNMIYQLELMRQPSLMDRLLATHPPTAKRIVEIERLLDTEHY